MALSDLISELITPAVQSAGFFLEEVTIANPGNHKIVTCVIDAEKPLNLDEVTLVSREISALLDEAAFMEEIPFTLEVTSPGVDRPLTLPRHWKKNLTRLVRIILLDATQVTGRLTNFDENDVTLIENIKGREKVHSVAFAQIKRAQVEIEFNRKGDN